MNTQNLLLIYIIILGLISILLVAGYRKNRKYFEHLDRKDNPLYFLYPAAGLIYSLLRKTGLIKPGKGLVTKLRQIYVKENVAEEVYLYSIKKTAYSIAILLAASVLGLMFCFSQMTSGNVDRLERNDYGDGETVYRLDAVYEGSTEDVEIVLKEVEYSEEEAIKKMDTSIDGIKKELLGENTDAEHISMPLNLISSYEDIAIFWEIEKNDIVDYNGELSIKDEEKDVLVELYANLSLGDTKRTYVVPIVVTGTKQSEKEKLVGNILKAIDSGNSAFNRDVELPREIDGQEIYFKAKSNDNGHIFIVLGLIGALLIFFGYEKSIDKVLQKRNEQLYADFPNIVSKLGLFYGAGLSIYSSFEKIVSDHEKEGRKEDHFAYNEMKMTLEKIRNGMSERQAYAEFGKRCALHPYVRLGNLLEQNLSKGTKGMKELLKAEVKDAFEEKKKFAKKKGEEASTKLLLPMVMMLVVVIVIIAVPALMTIQL